MNSPKDQLSTEVADRIGRPFNVYAVRATLESMGIRNIDAQTDYSSKDLQSLAEATYEFLNQQRSDYFTKKINPEFRLTEKEKDYTKLSLNYLARYFPLGVMHVFPVYLQIATIILFGYSIWTYLGFNQVQATAVILGVILGLIVTGGFVQLISRQVSHFWINRDYEMARKTAWNIVRNCMKTFVVFILAVLLINFLANLYPFKFLIISFIYAFGVGMLLLLASIFHPLKRRWLISVCIGIASLVALLLFWGDFLEIYYTHWIGIAIGCFLMYLSQEYIYKKQKERKEKIFTATSKDTVLLYRNHRYFIYGLMFYLFLFTDRLLAWSVSDSIPFIFFYEVNYEIGMDMAILVFFSLAGILEYAITHYTTIMDRMQKGTNLVDWEKYSESMQRVYHRHLLLLIVGGLFFTFLLYLFLMDGTWFYQAFDQDLTDLSIKIALLGSLGYIFLVIGMLNTLYLFTLNHSKWALDAMIYGLIANIAIGLLASRAWSYEYAVLGLIAGAFVYASYTYRKTRIFFKNLDQHYYAVY